VYQHVLSAATVADPHAETPGSKTIKTRSGEHVNRLEKGKYQVLTTGVILTSTDPDAE
jgi:hypothetical protein